MSWSILNFTGEEIIKLATEIEKRGREFYLKAAQKVDDPQAKGMLLYLADEEERHISDFECIGADMKEQIIPNEAYVGEYGDYLKAIIDNHVFNLNNIDDLVKDMKVFREALAVALRFEKDSIMIFQELYNAADAKGKEVLSKLIEEEKEHIRRISKLHRLH